MAFTTHKEIPNVEFQIMTDDGSARVTSREIFSGKNAILFAVVGAFWPACHYYHLPGYLEDTANFKRYGIDLIACTGTNDIFVFDEWAKALEVENEILFLADGNADFARAMGLVFDARTNDFGVRSKRYAMWVVDCVIRELHVEPDASVVDFSSSAAMLQVLQTFNTGSLNA